MSKREASTDATFWASGDDRSGLQCYRTLVEMVDGGVFQLDADDRVVAVDDALLELTRYSREEVVGEPISVLLDEAETVGLEAVRSRSETRDSAAIDVGIRTAGGATVPCELHLETVRRDGGDGEHRRDDRRSESEHVIGVVRHRDRSAGVTRPERGDRPASADGLPNSLVPALEAADVGVFVLDDDFDIAWINEATERYFGIDRAAVLGRNKQQVIDETIRERVDDADRFRDAAVATYDDNEYVERFECRITPDEDREERWLEHRSRPIESGPYAGGRVELYYDVTDQRRRLDQLRRLNEVVGDWLVADSDADAAERACGSLQEILDLEVNGVFRHDPETTALRPLALSEPGRRLFDEPPTFERGEGIAWRVFETGRPEIYADVTADPDVYNPDTPIRSEIILPVGSYGIIIAGSTQRDAFDRGDLSLAKIAASSLEATFSRLENERRLERERAQTERLIRTAPVAISVEDDAGETVLENQRAASLPGFPAREAVTAESGQKRNRNGNRDGDRTRDRDRDWTITDPSGTPLEPDRTPSARVRETGEPVLDAELEIDGPDGDRTWVSINAAPVFAPDGALDRVISVGEDITALKEHERQLERRKTELETELSEILGRVSDAFYALDEEWRFTHVNDRAAAILQRSEEELLGTHFETVYGDGRSEGDGDGDDVGTDAATAADLETRDAETGNDLVRAKFREAMATQRRVNFETYLAPLDVWLEFNAYPSETGLSVYFRDVTERKEYERRLEASNERLEQFAYAASHDLQEPLRMISSYLGLIDRRYGDEFDADGREFLEYAVDGAERMREMIDGLLEYSRIETQGDPFEPVELDDVLAAVRDDLQLRIDESDADVTAASLPRVRGDAGQLRQVFQNLLDNAIEYSGDAPPAVHVAAEREGSMWRVSVADDGIGIAADETERVFDVFERLHSHEEHAGTGIGLTLCKRIVERHGGEIGIDAEAGAGTTVSFTLPAASDD